MFKKALLTATITCSILLYSGGSTAAQGPAPQKADDQQPSDEITGHATTPIERLIIEVATANGIVPGAFIRMAHLESRLNPNAFHKDSKACGLFQFIPSTAKQYALVDCRDPSANAIAAAKLWNDNTTALQRCLGRGVTSGETYLAHQQGARGACLLLKNPGKRAIDIIGERAVTLNGGTTNMAASQFTKKWTSKFAAIDSKG